MTTGPLRATISAKDKQSKQDPIRYFKTLAGGPTWIWTYDHPGCSLGALGAAQVT